MKYQFWVSLTVTVVIGLVNTYGTYLTRQQLKLQIRTIPTSKQQKSSPSISRKYLYGPTVVMVLLAAVSWIPYFLGETQATLREIPPAFISQYFAGVRRDVADRYVFASATVGGTSTAGKYGEKNSIFLFCRVSDNKIDPMSDSTIDRSKRFDLTQRVLTIEVPLNKESTNRLL